MGSPMGRPVHSSIACFAMVFERCARPVFNEMYVRHSTLVLNRY